jgi:hypothetical protein
VEFKLGQASAQACNLIVTACIKNHHMDQRQQLSLQKQVLEYFNEVDNLTFAKVVESFVFHLPNDGVSELIEKFLKDNDLEKSYINYVIDYKKLDPDSFFKRSKASESDLIENIKHAFLIASFNRHRDLVVSHDKMKRNYDKLAKDVEGLNKAIDKIMDAGSVERFDEGMDDLKEYYSDLGERKKHENRKHNKTRKNR